MKIAQYTADSIVSCDAIERKWKDIVPRAEWMDIWSRLSKVVTTAYTLTDVTNYELITIREKSRQFFSPGLPMQICNKNSSETCSTHDVAFDACTE